MEYSNKKPDVKYEIVVIRHSTSGFYCGCIDSILAQTYTNIEVILVDDSSPDRCGQIADEYAAKGAYYYIQLSS